MFKNSKYSKTLTIILFVAIAAIVALVVFLAVDYARKSTAAKRSSDFVEEFQGNTTTSDSDDDGSSDEGGVELDTSASTSDDNNSATATKAKKPKYNGFDVEGTMRIPSINLKQPILTQNSAAALNNGLILLYPKENLNKPGNTVIQGHNYRNGQFFSNLKKVKNGDKIYVTDYTGVSLTYTIYNIFEAAATDTSFYIRDTGGLAELTLSTCTDANQDQRTIVFARQDQ